MKRVIIYLFVLTSVCQSANEIRAFCPGATTCFSVVREIDGDVWYVTGEVFEVWGTGARTAADYDIALTDKSGGMFVGTMDTNIGAGQYYIVTHQQAGGAPADTDPAIWVEKGYWDSDEWFGNPTVQDINDIDVDFPTKEEIRAEMDANSTDFNTIIADTNELQTDWTNGGRLDLLIDAIKYKTDLITILDTTVAEANDANTFTLTDGIDVNNALNYAIIIIKDANDGHWEPRWISLWESDKEIIVDRPFGFTPAVGDVVHIMGTGYGGWLKWIKNHIPNKPAEVFDFRYSTGGGTRTLNAEDEDP